MNILDRISFRLKLWARSSYCMGFRRRVNRLGITYTRVQWWERLLDGELPAFRGRIPVETRVLSLDDLKIDPFKGTKLASGDDIVLHHEAAKRMGAGDTCIVAVTGDSIAGYVWLLMQKTHYEPILEADISFADDEVLIYDGFVAPKYRRSDVGKTLASNLMIHLKSKGFRRVVGLVAAENLPSQMALRACGLRPTKTESYLRLLWFRRRAVSPIDREPGTGSQ